MMQVRAGPYSEVPAGRIETDAERLFLDHDTEFLLPLHLVLVLPLCGASGRALAGSDQHCPQRVRHTVGRTVTVRPFSF